MIRSFRARLALWMAAAVAVTGLLVGAISIWAVTRIARDGVLDRARLIGESVDPVAVEAILQPGNPDLDLALDVRLTALRRDPDVLRIAVIDAHGQRVPPTDEAEAPAIRGTELYAISGDSVLVAHPLVVDGTEVGYTALELRYPRREIWVHVGLVVVATALVVVLAMVVAMVAAIPVSADVRRIVAAIERLGRGEVWLPADLREGDDELGRVGRALRDLASRLELAAIARGTPPTTDEGHPDDAPPAVRLVDVPLRALLSGLSGRVPAALRPGVAFAADVDVPEDLVVRTDPAALEFVLRHLLDNAARETFSGAVTLTAHVADGEVSVVVQDTGPGLSDLAARYLFRPVPGAGSNGFGLGLAVSARYARAVGARLTHDARYHRGARFLLRFPVAGAAAAQGAA